MRDPRSFASSMAVVLAAVAPLEACASEPLVDPPPFASVHDRLESGPVRLDIATTPDTGSVGAQLDTLDGWQSGTAALSIEDGALVASVDDSGALHVASFELAFAPIELPPAVFGTAAQLLGVRLELAVPVTAPLAWKGADAASTALPLDLELSWSLAVDGRSTPLGVQHLPAIPLAVTITGTRERIAVALRLRAVGELWSWADLLELTALDVVANAATDGDQDAEMSPPPPSPPPSSELTWSLDTLDPTVTETLG